MDWQRYILIGAIALVSLMLINQWTEFQDRNAPVQSQETTLTTAIPDAPPAVADSSLNQSDLPSVASNDAATSTAPDTTSETASGSLIQVTTDVFSIYIDPRGGDLVKVALLDYLAEIDDPNAPLILLNRTQSTTYVAQSGLIGQNATDTADGRPLFSSAQTNYTMSDDSNELNVDLTLQQGDVKLTKRYTFYRGDHLVKMSYLVNNGGSEPWKANLFGQIKRDSHDPVKVEGFGMRPYLGAAITTPDENYKKVDFKDLDESNGFKTSLEGGWVAMVQHYFLSAWVPDQGMENHFNLRRGQEGTYLFGFTSPAVTVAPGQEGSLTASFYAGPKDINRLEEISPYLDLTVDYGWLWWIAKPLFHLLDFIHGILGSWGWSIIALTVIIKLAFFHLSATSYRSMAKMRKFGPELQRMKELYGDDRQRMSQEMMKLYSKEKINPLSGCLPIIVQMPVFISLYWVLMESVELRHTPFLGWISDLSVKDPLYILPVIMGVTMFIQQKLNPTPPDPTQARIMQMLPIVFTFMFMWFPAGLVLYWVVNNTLSILQQYIITRQIEASNA